MISHIWKYMMHRCPRPGVLRLTSWLPASSILTARCSVVTLTLTLAQILSEIYVLINTMPTGVRLNVLMIDNDDNVSRLTRRYTCSASRYVRDSPAPHIMTRTWRRTRRAKILKQWAKRATSSTVADRRTQHREMSTQPRDDKQHLPNIPRDLS